MMDDPLIRRVVLAGLGFVLLGVLYAFAGRQSAGHRDNIDSARTNLLMRGCAMAGIEPATKPMEDCVRAAGAVCTQRRGGDVQDCAQRVAHGAAR